MLKLAIIQYILFFKINTNSMFVRKQTKQDLIRSALYIERCENWKLIFRHKINNTSIDVIQTII